MQVSVLSVPFVEAVIIKLFMGMLLVWNVKKCNIDESSVCILKSVETITLIKEGGENQTLFTDVKLMETFLICIMVFTSLTTFFSDSEDSCLHDNCFDNFICDVTNSVYHY